MSAVIERILIDTIAGFVQIDGYVSVGGQATHCASRVQADTFLAIPDEERREYARAELEIQMAVLDLASPDVLLVTEYTDPAPTVGPFDGGVRSLQELNTLLKASRNV